MARGSVSKTCHHGTTGTAGNPACRVKHGSWGYIIPTGRDPETGKPRQKRRRGFATRDEAEQQMTAELSRLDAGTWVDDRGVTLGEWLDQWIALKVAAGCEVKTIAGYRVAIAEWRRVLGDIRLRDLRRSHIDQALIDLRVQPVLEVKRGRTVATRSPATLDQYRRVLRAALTEARLRDLIAVNYAEGRMTAIAPRGRADFDLWDPAEMVAYVKAAEALPERPIGAGLIVAAFSGLRRGEVMGARWSALDLTWADLDHPRGGITVDWTLVEPGRGAIPADLLACPVCGRQHAGMLWKPKPKSQASRRWVPLVKPVRRALLAVQADQDVKRALVGPDWTEHGLIFADADGCPIRPARLGDAHTAILKAMGKGERLSLHKLRHSACSLLLAAGVPIDTVQMILGHASPEVTRRIYGHLQRGSVAQQMEDAFEALGITHDQAVTNRGREIGGGRSRTVTDLH